MDQQNALKEQESRKLLQKKGKRSTRAVSASKNSLITKLLDHKQRLKSQRESGD